MLIAHRYFGLALGAVFLSLTAMGVLAWLRNKHPGPIFFTTLAVGQIGLGVQALIGILLFSGGGRRPFLHYIYGAFPVVVLVFAHRWSKKHPGLEWATFALAGFFIFGLQLRGLMTGQAG
ncbi:MAG: hypothetical protein ABR507_07485 [Actinomycetota bacterium]|nr:hypothetical protein [Actinomycetota bacterium]